MVPPSPALPTASASSGFISMSPARSLEASEFVTCVYCHLFALPPLILSPLDPTLPFPVPSLCILCPLSGMPVTVYRPVHVAGPGSEATFWAVSANFDTRPLRWRQGRPCSQVPVNEMIVQTRVGLFRRFRKGDGPTGPWRAQPPVLRPRPSPLPSPLRPLELRHGRTTCCGPGNVSLTAGQEPEGQCTIPRPSRPPTGSQARGEVGPLLAE